ncbi:hypothetical protein N7509_011514 [Penicillium cosmopolitanum]|uniref:Uncharacterized protein n=1 Tax=Penicillium cosmopolitanum TaxID=1131564 RepID=A0A9W9SHD7_9EURO|nr:uncharacterized protein N7509_011514 [Penicillium cosmopolitanum]KAJ5378395.1 hypothetical protein N7509_011514 [Penicillium cosmopolitanum]
MTLGRQSFISRAASRRHDIPHIHRWEGETGFTKVGLAEKLDSTASPITPVGNIKQESLLVGASTYHKKDEVLHFLFF